MKHPENVSNTGKRTNKVKIKLIKQISGDTVTCSDSTLTSLSFG